MSEDMTRDAERVLRETEDRVGEQLAEGKSAQEVAEWLVGEGWEKGPAEEFVARVREKREEWERSPETRSAFAHAYRKRVRLGVAWATGGVIVAVVTYAVGVGGWGYIVALGAIAYGAVCYVTGRVGGSRYGE